MEEEFSAIFYSYSLASQPETDLLAVVMLTQNKKANHSPGTSGNCLGSIGYSDGHFVAFRAYSSKVNRIGLAICF